MATAYCWRNGVIKIARGQIPGGALPLAYGNERELRKAIDARSRHAYDGKTYLVPGIPEAETDDEAGAAAKAFSAWLVKCNGHLVSAISAVA